jgi:hypothetical protein
MLNDFNMVSKGRDSAAHARNRQTLARGYTKGLIVFVGNYIGCVGVGVVQCRGVDVIAAGVPRGAKRT